MRPGRSTKYLSPTGEVQLPAEARKALGVRAGDALDIEWAADGRVFVRRAVATTAVDDAAALSDAGGRRTASERGVDALRGGTVDAPDAYAPSGRRAPG